jgi:hypothetical protein
VAISGSGFSLGGITAPVTLTAGQGVEFRLTSAPTAGKAWQGQVQELGG